VISFEAIRARAERRKGGAEALERLMPPTPAHERSPAFRTTACWRK